MTEEEAERFLAEYRQILKRWTMAVSGFVTADTTTLYKHLEDGQMTLSDIAITYPDKAYSVDILVNSSSRPWPGLLDTRPERPAKRETR